MDFRPRKIRFTKRKPLLNLESLQELEEAGRGGVSVSYAAPATRQVQVWSVLEEREGPVQLDHQKQRPEAESAAEGHDQAGQGEGEAVGAEAQVRTRGVSPVGKWVLATW